MPLTQRSGLEAWGVTETGVGVLTLLSTCCGTTDKFSNSPRFHMLSFRQLYKGNPNTCLLMLL